MLTRLRLGKEPAKVHEYLLRVNMCHEPVDDGGCRTLVLLDATGSMASVLSLTKQTIGTMFHRAFDVLGQGPVAGITIQIGVYRNYNVERAELAFQASEWHSSPEPLVDFLSGVEVGGGCGEEAVELGLRHANQEHAREPISQVIIIGDAPPQTRAQADSLRLKYYSAQFPTPTYFDAQRATLLAQDVELHAFYVPTQASSAHQSHVLVALVLLPAYSLRLLGPRTETEPLHRRHRAPQHSPAVPVVLRCCSMCCIVPTLPCAPSRLHLLVPSLSPQ